MILFKNSLMVLDYEPSTDILTVEWPLVEGYLLSEIRHTLQTLVENVRNYHVKYLLIDASHVNSDLGIMDSAAYKQILSEFVYGLMQTRLQKSARVVAVDKNQEAKTHKLTTEVKQAVAYQIQNQEFKSKQEARQWLLA